MSNNSVKDWGEFQKLAELHKLEDLLFVGNNNCVRYKYCEEWLNCVVGNPLEEKHSSDGDWRDQATRRLSKLKKLDGIPVVRGDEEEES